MDLTDWLVLIVDDDLDNLRLLEDVLLYARAQVTSASTGTGAIDLLQTHTYRMVLLDIQMPNFSGWDVIHFIRGHPDPSVRQQLVIAVTAFAMSGDRERTLAGGFDGYISKPIDVITFVSTIAKIVETRH
ncbi:MAG TPA: response regulator [Aggregatilineales bacterium]|nr:response regulator [Aggregatilineales bacterium]